MSDRWPVTVAVSRPDGTVEHVRVGTAVKQGDGFALTLEAMTIKPEGAERGGFAGAGFAGGGAPRPPPPGGGGGMLLPNYGRSKGQPIVGASLQDLEFYANGSRRSLADPSKARFHEKEKVMLAALEAEIARQRGGSPEAPPSDDVPPPGDDDAPF
jgi:hypothetical protein